MFTANPRLLVAAAAAVLVSSSALIAQDAKPAQDAQPAAAAQPPASQPTVSEPMDFRKLKELLPAELAGVKRTEATGKKSAFGDFKVSVARATYGYPEKADAPHVDLEISDYAATKGMVEGLAFWTKMEVDREGDTGYEKSLKIANQPAMETYANEGKVGNLQVLVANRYMVQVHTPPRTTTTSGAAPADKPAARDASQTNASSPQHAASPIASHAP